MLKSAILNGRDLADLPVQAVAAGEEIAGLVVTLTNRAAEPAVLAQLLASAFKITLAEGEKKTQDLRVGR